MIAQAGAAKFVEPPCRTVRGDWRRPDIDAVYEISWNQDATFGQIMPRPAASEIPSFYAIDDYYTHGRANTGNSDRIGTLDRALLHLAWRLDGGVEPTASWWQGQLGDAPKRILEIGCGDGGTLSMLRGLGHEVVGIEPDPAARSRACDASLEVHDGVGEDIPTVVAERRFDVVIMMHVLEHCLDPAAAIRNVRRLLVPDGVCIAETPNNACLGATVFGAAWYWLDVPRHLNFFTAVSLRKAFEQEGFDITEELYRGYVRQFGVGWIEAQRTIAERLGIPAASRRTYWRYLARTAFAPPALRYDSVRVVCRKGHDNRH